MSGHRSRHIRQVAQPARKKRPNRYAWLTAAVQAKVARITAQLEQKRRIQAEDNGRAPGRAQEKDPDLAVGVFDPFN